MDEYKKLDNQPLKFVLAEFRFSQVMQIAEYIPKLQEALRKKYPISDKRTEQSIHVQPSGVAVSSIDSWIFLSANKKNAIEINQDRLIYFTSEYPRYDGFAEVCQEALSVLAEIVDPSLILRIGLRYSDLVTVSENETISDLVDAHFTFPKCVSELGSSQHQRSETFVSTGLGRLAIRTLYGHNNLSCFPDIQGLPISIDVESEASERIILDFDHFWEAGEDATSFEVEDVLNKLQGLHDISREAFWKITTDYARNEKWA